MLKLCGFPLSNYHNKAKLVLLEKGVPFEEVLVPGGALEHSPMGKVPYLLTDEGSLCESQAIVEYAETRWPTPALMPQDPWAAAKVRELNIVLELHVELVVRQLYGQAFFGMPALPEKFTERVRVQLEKGLRAFRQLAKFSPYVAGSAFTLADCSAYVHLPVAAMASRAVYGSDLVAEAGVDWKPYVKFIEERPTAQKVAADRKADQQQRTAAIAAKVAQG